MWFILILKLITNYWLLVRKKDFRPVPLFPSFLPVGGKNTLKNIDKMCGSRVSTQQDTHGQVSSWAQIPPQAEHRKHCSATLTLASMDCPVILFQYHTLSNTFTTFIKEHIVGKNY